VDDCDTGLSSTSAGKYGFNTSTTVGTLTWSTIISSSITYLTIPYDSSAPTGYDYTTYFGTVIAGDVITWYDAAGSYEGRWVSYRVTAAGTGITGGMRFPVEYISHYDTPGTANVPGTDSAAQFRFSRADAGDFPSGSVVLNGVTCNYGTGGTTTQGIRMDSDGDMYGTVTSASYTSQYTWLTSGTNSDFEVKLIATSGTLTSGTLDSWLGMGSDRTWSKTGSLAVFNGTLSIRDTATGSIVGTATIVLDTNTA
jgi:hypothetical protein